MRNSFRFFNSSPEVIRLAVMLSIHYPLSQRQVEDILYERGIDVEPSKTTVGEYLDTWLADVAPRTVGRKALERYRGLARNQIKPHLGAVQLQKLRPADVDKWHPNLLQCGPKLTFLLDRLMGAGQYHVTALA